ncbi:MAG: peptide-binding protein [Deltaproteobacteria bacterium]|nr:peptide-binding protein [Deltaproteobacteria bacterium]
MKRFLLKSLSLIFLVNLLACPAPVKQDPYTLNYHIGAEPDTLNRLTSTDAYSSTINSYIFDSLLERDNKTLDWIPKLAHSWEISEDKLQYTFWLREDVYWHDGKKFTADDVIYTFEKIQDPKVNTPHTRVYYQDVDRVEKIDDFTVRFTYKKPYFKALGILAGIPIVPKHIFETDQDFNNHTAGRKPIGNGPYRFVEWKTGKHIVLVRNEDYWDTDHLPEIKKIVFKIIADDTLALKKLKKGELDYAGLTPIAWEKQTNSEKFNRDFVKHKYYSMVYRYIGWNLRKPFFSDKRVRQALTHLTNRQGILEKLEFGLGKITTGPLWPLGDFYNHQLKPREFNIKKAIELLEEAGWVDSNGNGIRDKDGVEFEFTFLIPSGRDFYEKLATILKKDLEKAGISMKIENMEWSIFVQKLHTREFDAVSLAWSGGGFDEDPYQIWHSSQAESGSNFIGFKNPEADYLLEVARTTFNKEERVGLYRLFHEIIYEEQPYTFLYTGMSLVARHRRFHNVHVYKGGLDIREWTLEE